MQRNLLILGLLLPGAGSLLRGRPIEALAALWSVGFLTATALVSMAVWNGNSSVQPLDLLKAMRHLPAHPVVPPVVMLLVVMALAIHVLAALGGARPTDRDT